MKRVVFRALIGGYEELTEAAVAHDTDIDFICFTDDKDLRSDTWEIRHVEPRFALDQVRSARCLKILGHESLADYDQSLWIDNTVELLQPPEPIFDWLGSADIAAPIHSFRVSVLAEAEELGRLGLDDTARILEQVRHYEVMQPEALTENPHWTGMFVRKNNDLVAETMNVWWEQILRYSRRDQLSFVPSVRRTGADLVSVPLAIHGSELHNWPVATRHIQPAQDLSLFASASGLELQVGALQNALERTTATFADRLVEVNAQLEAATQARENAERALAAAEQARAELAATTGGAEVSELSRQVTELAAQRDAALDEAAQRQRLLDALYQTTSWRITAPLRSVRRRTSGS